MIIKTIAVALALEAALCTPCSILERNFHIPSWTELHEKETPIILEAQPEESPQLINMGVFEITAYCPCYKCCGDSCGLTSSGTIPTAGRTVGVGKTSPFKAGDHILINGHEYVVEDSGNVKSNVIDIYMNTHKEALQWGRQKIEVYLING